MKSTLLKYYPFLALLLLCVFYWFKAIDFPAHDFANYYFGGKFLAEGNFNSNIYFPYEFNKAIFDSGHQNIFVSYAPNTPFLAFFFLLFAGFSLALAKIIFNSLSVVLFVFSIYRLFNHYKIDWRFALLIPVLFLVPIKNNLLFGQVYFLLFFLLSEGWLAYEKGQWKSMSLFWSLAILLKVSPVLLVVLFVFRKQWKPLSYLVAFCLLLFGFSVLFTGFDIWIFYWKEVLPKASNGEIATAFVDNYQSVFMFLKRLFIDEPIENPNAFFHEDNWFFALVFAFKIGVLAACYFVSKRISNAFFTFSYWILAMFLLSPYGSTYSMILLVFPLLALLKSNLLNTQKVILCGLLFLINNLPLSLFIENEFPFSYLRLFLLIAFSAFFIVSLFQKSVLLKAILLGCIAFIIGTFSISSLPKKGESILTVESPILIYDYIIEDNRLTYFYWNEKGKNSVSIPLVSHSSKPLEIRNNQIFHKKRQITFDQTNKRKPILINDKIIYFLSDSDRGIGFFTLKKINVR